MESHSTIEYPVSDGKPMGETDFHVEELTRYALYVLKDHFEGQQVYVAGNNFLYYQEGDPKVCVSPDTYVVKDVDPKLRDTFKVWEEGGRRPCCVFEITSKNTRRNDLGEKMSRYRDDLQVAEYFLFDPRGEWIPEMLRGFRLVGEAYVAIERDERDRLASEQLGLQVGVADGHLRFYLPDAPEPLPTRRELADRAQRLANDAEQRADDAEQRAEAEQQRADAEQQRAEAEQQRADAAQAEVARLKAELERLRGET